MCYFATIYIYVRLTNMLFSFHIFVANFNVAIDDYSYPMIYLNHIYWTQICLNFHRVCIRSKFIHNYKNKFSDFSKKIFPFIRLNDDRLLLERSAFTKAHLYQSLLKYCQILRFIWNYFVKFFLKCIFYSRVRCT